MPEQTAYRDKSREALRERFSTGVFGLGSNSFTFDVCVDRQFPPGSIVKQVFWVGDFLASRRRSQIDALSINWQRQIQAGKTTIAEVHEGDLEAGCGREFCRLTRRDPCPGAAPGGSANPYDI